MECLSLDHTVISVLFCHFIPNCTVAGRLHIHAESGGHFYVTERMCLLVCGKVPHVQLSAG